MRKKEYELGPVTQMEAFQTARRRLFRNRIGGKSLVFGDTEQIRVLQNCEIIWEYGLDPEWDCPRCNHLNRARTSFEELILPQISYCRMCAMGVHYFEDKEDYTTCYRHTGEYELIHYQINQ